MIGWLDGLCTEFCEGLYSTELVWSCEWMDCVLSFVRNYVCL